MRGAGKYFFAVILLGSIYVYFSTSGHTNSRLRVQPQYLDFGIVRQTLDLTVSLPIENPSDFPVEIRRFRTSCSCSSVEPETLIIPAHGEAVVKVDIDLSAASSKEANPFSRSMAVDIAAEIDEEIMPPWRISGVVATSIVASPSALWLAVDRQARSSSTFSVLTNPVDEIVDIQVRGLEDKGAATVSRSRPGKFLVSFVPNVTSVQGEFSWIATLVGTNTMGEEVATAEYRVFGCVLEEIRCYPDRLVINDLAAGQDGVVTNSVSLTDEHGRTLEKVQVLLPMPEGLRVHLPSEPGDSMEVKFTHDPAVTDISPDSTDILKLQVKIEGVQKPVEVFVPVVRASAR